MQTNKQKSETISPDSVKNSKSISRKDRLLLQKSIKEIAASAPKTAKNDKNTHDPKKSKIKFQRIYHHLPLKRTRKT